MTRRNAEQGEADAKVQLGAPERHPGVAKALSDKQRDFMLLYIFVLAQHGYIERAGVLAEAVYVLGDTSPEVVLARAVLDFFLEKFPAALAHLEELDRIDPIERFGAYTFSHAQRMRRYLKARCFHKLRQPIRARDVVDSYLRHGTDGGEPEDHSGEQAVRNRGEELPRALTFRR
jgi:hypothetical protein